MDYDGKLFSRGLWICRKKDVIKAKYEWECRRVSTRGEIIDVLGEEFFETFEVDAK